MAGVTKKMELVAIASKASQASRAKVLAILERNTGPDPDRHLWDYSKGHEHNTYRYFLHASPVAPDAEPVMHEQAPPESEEQQEAA